MKQLVKMFLILFVVCVCVCSCDTDPYKNRRPIDYEESSWLCEGKDYKIYLQNGETVESMLFIDGEGPKNISFLWSAFSSYVDIYEQSEDNDSRTLILTGNCEFDKKQFVINVTEKFEYSELFPDILIFNRVN